MAYSGDTTVRWIHWVQYVPLRLTAFCFRLMGPRFSHPLARGLGSLAYRGIAKLRRRVERNIERSMPELSPEDVRRVGKASVQHFVQLAVEMLQTPARLRHDNWEKAIEYDEQELARSLELIHGDRPTILIGGHCGNWEVLGYLLAVRGIQVTALARPLDNPLINRWVMRERQRHGLKIVTKFGATEEMVQLMESGGLLGIVADQNAGKKGLFVPFFGRLASTYKSVGLLAIQHRASIVCGCAVRVGDYRFRLGITDIIEPEDWENQPDPLYYVTARYVRAIEAMVRLAPEQYLWNHRRWRSRPKHEYAGRPLPDRLRRQLLDLPWIQEQDLERLAAPVGDEER